MFTPTNFRGPIIRLMLALATLAAGSSGQIVTWDLGDGGNGHSYEAVLVTQGITWNDARDATAARPGNWHLATITSAEENAFLYDLIDEPQFWNCCLSNNSRGPWLGGFSSGLSANDWQWVTGEPWTYTKWGPAEPFGNGDVLGFFGYQTLMNDTWNDLPNWYLTYGYLVETEDEVPIAGPGRIILSGENWMFTDTGFFSAPDAEQFVEQWVEWLCPGGMADILAYAFSRGYFSSPGDQARGEGVFRAKDCSGCHGIPSTGAPELKSADKTHSLLSVAASAWNHGPEMKAAMDVKGDDWPTMSADEFHDLVAYLDNRR